MILEIFKFLFFSACIVIISKYILVPTLNSIVEMYGLSKKVAGNISGVATSMPEFLTVTISALKGLIDTGAFNILSSNLINLLLFIFSILISGNKKYLKNSLIKIEMFLIIMTIFIPINLIMFHQEMNIQTALILFIFLLIFMYINNLAHIKYSKNFNDEVNSKNSKKGSVLKFVFYLVVLFFVVISLYLIGEVLGNVIANLEKIFNFPQWLLGILLGLVTSFPELVTFIEAQRKKEGNIGQNGITEAINNLFASNVLNLCVIEVIGIIIYNLVRK